MDSCFLSLNAHVIFSTLITEKVFLNDDSPLRASPEHLSPTFAATLLMLKFSQ